MVQTVEAKRPLVTITDFRAYVSYSPVMRLEAQLAIGRLARNLEAILQTKGECRADYKLPDGEAMISWGAEFTPAVRGMGSVGASTTLIGSEIERNKAATLALATVFASEAMAQFVALLMGDFECVSRRRFGHIGEVTA